MSLNTALYLKLLFICLVFQKTYAAEEGDSCSVNQISGVCLPGSKCTTLHEAIQQRLFTRAEIAHCGFTVYEEMICCPKLTTSRPKPENRFNKRPAVEACERFKTQFPLQVDPHILGGTAVEEGEYPHMAALGYPVQGNESQYSFRCGGSLIDPLYVLTAAHCVYSPENQPEIVRLGTVDLDHSTHAVDIKIAKVDIHPNYTYFRNYDDIALLRLEKPVKFNELIQPICLMTNSDVIPNNSTFYVTGWGEIQSKSKSATNILLKAQLEMVDLQDCNATYKTDGFFQSKLDVGIVDTQLCALSLSAGACRGDSGGPLTAILNLDFPQYSLMGVISSGPLCSLGSKTPGLYTRIPAYIDYIEKIVDFSQNFI